MEGNTSHYAVLGVPSTATMEELRAAWRAVAYANHPDMRGDEEKFKMAAVAWATLRDPVRRARYDKLLAMEKGCPTCGGTGVVQRQRGFTRREVRPCPACAS